jgi:50S ribosomal protein L16 3-hydroxylase
MARVAIEIDAASSQPLGMPPARFLRDYWQKRPLLIRAAFPQFHNAITPEDLAGLACEQAALARIVLRDARRDRWTLRSGPFSEANFAKLPKSHWTLLVQDVDKWDADVADLLDEFTFLPAWRIDDVMVSYATDGGGVGAHVDNYDVFLVQGRGRRRWRISTDPGAPHEFREDAELKLLKSFQPTHNWVLEPGDALYLPPGVPHDGVAIGECMTFSVGMRAPSVAELVIDLAESVAEPLGEDLRFTDANLAPPRDTHEIDAAAMRRVAASLAALRDMDDPDLRAWFGQFITRYRSVHEAVPAARQVSAARLAAALPGSTLLRNPWSRCAWTRHGRGAQLFVAGTSYFCSLGLARLLCAKRELAGDTLVHMLDAAAYEVLATLINDGHWIMRRPSRQDRGRAS